MGATKVGLITEGLTDRILAPVLLQRIAQDKAAFGWPVNVDDLEHLRVRKRGAGGIVPTLARLARFTRDSSSFDEHAFFVVLMDNRAKIDSKKLTKLFRTSDKYVLGIAIEEIEAWWLGDRVSTLEWLGLDGNLPSDLRYAQDSYKSECDKDPKATLDALTRASRTVNSFYGKGNTALAREFADRWRSNARLLDIEGQCPKGFGSFCKDATNAFRRSKTQTGLLF